MDEFHGLDDGRLIGLVAEARALDMLFILSTQYPTAAVISTAVRASLVSRIAFKVADKVASHVILGKPDAVTLLTRGDCLVQAPSGDLRAQAGWCTPQDRDALSRYLKQAD